MVDSVSFTVVRLLLPIGQVTAIRVQDVARQIWFNWDIANGWTGGDGSGLIKCQIGGALYVASYAINNGGDGNLSIQLRNAVNAQIIVTKTENVLAGGSIGIEWNGVMPASSDLSFIAAVAP